MDSRITKEVKYTRIFERNRASKAKVVINVGGARSSKSYSIMQLIIAKMLTEEHKKFGICRKTFPALRMSTMKPFFDMLKDYGIYDERRHNKTFNTYEHGTNFIQFFGLDEAEKIKSTGFNYVWLEESNEFDYVDFTNLKLRLSEPCKPEEVNQLFMSFNPIDANNWIATKAVKESDVEVIHSTFQDNPFLSEAYVKTLLDLIHQDDNFYRVYALGEWGKVEGRIYTNYRAIPTMPLFDSLKTRWAYGLDFGLVNPSALIKVVRADEKMYAQEVLYKSGLTTSDIIEFLNHVERGDIYADPSAKMMIEEIRRAGFNIYEGHKKVKDGIDFCLRQTILVPEDSVNLIKELGGYQWRKNPQGEGYMTEPVKYNDHGVDSMRYAAFGMAQRYGLLTSAPPQEAVVSTLTFNRRTLEQTR